MTTSVPPPPHPPEAWGPARALALRLTKPLERFLQVEAASGILLLLTTAIALVWANSPWRAAYEALWHTKLSIAVGSLSASANLHFFVNDGLMTLFFFVVGLEIRRETHQGELAELKRAALPVAAAIGGMVAPALIYLAFNPTGPNRVGWGVPTATDIAFAVGVLTLLGKRIPPALRVLLLALAIIDDIGAIVVIAVFYSGAIAMSGLVLAAAGVLGVFAFQRVGLRRPFLYVLPGVVIWTGLHRAGIHPTIAGVVLGLLTPVVPWLGEVGFLERAREALQEFTRTSERKHDVRELMPSLTQLHDARREAVPPVVRLESALHPWVAYGIMPIFALANAGVSLAGVDLAHEGSTTVMLGVAVGLVVGKPIGVVLASFAAVKLGVAALPRGVSFRGVFLVGAVAGVGFTMAIFVAGLAFPDAARLSIAKLAILAGSTVAAVGALVLGRVMPVTTAVELASAAQTADEAEASTEV